MCKKKNPIFYCMYLIIILMLGMCLEQPQTDSFLSFSEKNNAVSYIDSYDTENVKDESCTLEMLGIKNNTAYAKNIGKKTNLHPDAKVSLDFAAGGAISSVLRKVRSEVLEVQLPKLRSCVAVVNYIHNQDGKK